MGIGGVIALHRDDPDLRFVLVVATDGEAGEIAPGSGATRETLGAVRRREDHAGWEAIGRQPDRVEWLGLPDGGVADLPRGVLEDRIHAILADERPDVVVTFGPDGITGHPDHVTVGAATDAAFHRCREEPGPGLRRLLHGAFPQGILDRVNDDRLRRGEEAYDPTQVYMPRGVPDERITCSVDQSEVWALVRAAMLAHRSQLIPPWEPLTDSQWRGSMRTRHYVQAWPPPSPGAPRQTGIFDNL